MSVGFGQGQGMVLGAFTPLANSPAFTSPPNPAGDGIITEGGDFLITESTNEYIVTE